MKDADDKPTSAIDAIVAALDAAHANAVAIGNATAALADLVEMWTTPQPLAVVH